MTKPFYKSQTIISALLGLGVVSAPIVYNAIEERRFLNEAELTAILGGLYAFEKTAQGRKKATEGISFSFKSKPEPELPIAPSFSNQIMPEPEPEPDIDELDIDLDILSGEYKLIAKRDTILKSSWKSSDELKSSEKMEVKEGQEFLIDSWRFCNPKNGHIVAVVDEYPGINLFAFAPHWKLINSSGSEVSIDDEPKKKDLGKSFTLPGYKSTLYMNNFIGNTHFTWAEMTRNGERMPESKQKVDNGIEAAKMMEGFRRFIGNKPLVVTSWYRPLHVNRAIGSGDGSQHVQNRAVDFKCPSLNIYQLQRLANDYAKKNGYAIGFGAKKGFVHLDCRGYYTSWNY